MHIGPSIFHPSFQFYSTLDQTDIKAPAKEKKKNGLPSHENLKEFSNMHVFLCGLYGRKCQKIYQST
jgi:hypothetical protein